MNPNTRIITQEQILNNAIIEAKDMKYSRILVEISEGRIVWIEVTKKYKC